MPERRPRVALVSAASSRTHDEDLAPLSEALDAVGVESVVVDWHDDAVDWAGLDLAVVRSTWDYTERYPEFLAWVERAGQATSVLNPPPVLRWNTDKRYLRDLADAGAPVVPTAFFEPGDEVGLAADGACVVKPAVSAGARDTARYSAAQAGDALAHAGALLAAGRVAMIQPYMDAVDLGGETALVYIDGELSHGLRKGAILAGPARMVDGLYAEEKMSARSPSDAERAAAERVLSAAADVLGLGEPLLYARVDLVPGADGQPLLLELEVTEPSLFVTYAPAAAGRLAGAIAARQR